MAGSREPFGKQIFEYRQDHNGKPMQKGAGSLETWIS